MDILTGYDIVAACFTKKVGRRIIILPRVGSTNAVLSQMVAEQNIPAGLVVMAEYQAAGRGRLGRDWVSPPYASILMSVLLRPALPIAHAQHLTMAAAVAVAEALTHVPDITVGLKWPNDVMLRGADGVWRKVGGILVETVVEDGLVVRAIVGVGVNVNVSAEQLPQSATAATSLLVAGGHRHARAPLVGKLLTALERALAAGEAVSGQWRALLIGLGRAVTVRGAQTIDGIAEDVDSYGRLMVRDADGVLHAIAAGDVTLRAEGL